MRSILDTVLRVIASVRGNCLEESFIKIVFRLRGNTTRNSSDIAFLAFTQVKMTRNGELMRNRNTDRGEGEGIRNDRAAISTENDVSRGRRKRMVCVFRYFSLSDTIIYCRWRLLDIQKSPVERINTVSRRNSQEGSALSC